MATVTNRVVAVAGRGQDVIVSLDGTETLSKLPAITLGQQATVGSTSLVGYVSFIDAYGHSFRVSPKTPDARFCSTATGLLSVGEVITLA